MLDGPFRGSEAIARGLLTRGVLRGPRFRQVFADIYVPRGDTPPDLALRSRAAALLLPPDGALAGWSAAELLGAGCAPRATPVEIIAHRTGLRARPGLVVHRGAVSATDVHRAAGCPVTSPQRTAWDLARRLDLVDAVVAVDALARVGRFDPTTLIGLSPGTRGRRRLLRVVSLCDPRAESPMETRLRLVLVLHGLPAPAVQYRVLDEHGFPVARADLAYPEARLAIEYDGEVAHRARRRADDRRDLALAELDWETVRLGHEDVYLAPLQTADRVQRLRAARMRPAR